VRIEPLQADEVVLAGGTTNVGRQRLAAVQPQRAEDGMALGHGVGDDLVTPSVALDDGVDQADALVVACAVGVGEERESS
jgi:hypothetical protein